MVESYLVRNIVYALDLMGIKPNNWSDPTLFVFKDDWYVPVETITELLAQATLNGNTRKEISDFLEEVEPADVNPSTVPNKRTLQKPTAEAPPKDNETSRLFKPYYQICNLEPGLNEPKLREDFRTCHFAGAHPDKFRAVVGSLNAAARYGHDVGWEELEQFVPSRFRSERLPDILVASGFFYRTVPGRCDIKPKYKVGGVNVS